MAGRPEHESEFEPERVVVHDRRRIDPVTGLPRAAADVAAPAGESEPEADLLGSDLARVTAEMTADLQRLSAEYANYRKRVQRDQSTVVEMATSGLVDRLLPLLDDVDRARAHGDLEGAFKVVGEGLETVVTRLGVERFGAVGDPFDPNVHEAVMTAPEDASVSVPVCAQVFSPGYRFASGRIVRPAKVAVAEPGRAGAATAGEPVPAEAAQGPER